MILKTLALLPHSRAVVPDVLAGSPPFPVFNNHLEKPSTASISGTDGPLSIDLMDLTGIGL